MEKYKRYKDEKCGVYKITNIKNGKFYIGSSKNILRRWWEHRDGLNNNRHINKVFQNAWNKYGKDSFNMVILEECQESLLLEREQHYLDTFLPYKGVGYNVSKIAGGGDTYGHLSEKEKKRFIDKCVKFGEDNGMFGKKHSDEAKLKQKNKAKGRFSLQWFIDRNGLEEGTKKYEDRRKWLSESRKGKNNPMYGKWSKGHTGCKHSDESKIKISIANKKKT